MFAELPPSGFEYETYEVLPVPVTQLVEDGDIPKLGDQHVEDFHIPGQPSDRRRQAAVARLDLTVCRTDGFESLRQSNFVPVKQIT